MRLENCKNDSEQVSLKAKLQGFIANLFLTAGVIWFISLWIETLHAAYTLLPIVKLSIGDSLVGVGTLGTLIYLWVGWFIAVKYSKKAALVISERKQKILTMACGISFALGVFVSLLTYVVINDHLTSKGYSVKTKYTNMGIYKTYTKN